MSDLHEGSCCAMCAWDVDGICCCIPERKEPEVSKNLGNIPRQLHMTEEQEQTFTSGINKGRKLERKLITIRVMERVEDLRSCHKSDNCQELATLIESYLPEWLDERTE